MIVAIAGMPGSGKSRLFRQYAEEGFLCVDDINKSWHANIARVRKSLDAGARVVVSDIEFCRIEMRKKLEADLGMAVTWVFFENNPYHCARNVLYRRFVEKRDRPWLEEIQKIDRLSKTYSPDDKPEPVLLADCEQHETADQRSRLESATLPQRG